MHELSIATQLVKVVTRVKEENSADRVGQVTVDIGLLAGIDRENLDFCFEAITKGTPLEGAHLKIEEVKPAGKCRKCGEEYEVRLDDFTCPACGSTDFDMLSGSEISIREVEIESEEEG
jgi:hydrogenase nickel incorporation protein HypA/HybF